MSRVYWPVTVVPMAESPVSSVGAASTMVIEVSSPATCSAKSMFVCWLTPRTTFLVSSARKPDSLGLEYVGRRMQIR